LATTYFLAVDLVPELTKRGAIKEADAYYVKVADTLDTLVRDYPRSSVYLGNRAWLAVRCRRDANQAVDWAKRAVELSPDNIGLIETFAEARFQHKEPDAARALLKQALTKSPRDTLIPKLIKRVDGGDPAAPMPEK
jgi:predicted Zn-dependent protease